MTKREELELFLEKADELIDSKYILADVKLANLLKVIAGAETLLALFKNCLTDFDYDEARGKYLVRSKYLAPDKGEFVQPPNSRELLSFVFYTLVEIDDKTINFADFINKYFYEDGSFSSGYEAFINTMIKPFKNAVKILMESVIEGKLQDPIEALCEEEDRRAKQLEAEELRAKKERDIEQKAYAASIKKVKELLLEDKQKIKASKKKECVKEEMFLVIDMLANAVESDDKDAITYAWVSYKNLAAVHPFLLFFRGRTVEKIIGSILNAF